MKKLIATASLLLMVPVLAPAQETDHPYRGQGYFFFGLGTATGYSPTPFFKHVGGGGEGFLYKGLGFGVEAGYASYAYTLPLPTIPAVRSSLAPVRTAPPSARYSNTAWIGSADFSYHLRRHAARGGVDPFVLGGFSLVGPTAKGGGRGGPAGNFGGGANLWLAQHAALRFEFRDVVGSNYWVYTNYLSFRVGVTFR